MAKARFEREKVIESCVDLFWRQGFSGASMQQVVQATGLKPGSIYLSFGNKEALYKETLELYATRGIKRIRETLEGAPTISEGICLHFERLLLEAANEEFCSCLLVKTQLELAHGQKELQAFAAEKLAEVEGVFCEYLMREFDAETSSARATSIMLHLFGMRVYGYQPVSIEQMRKALHVGLPWLPWQTVEHT